MIVVIIAGGSGTRLWPLSTPDYPKHLLKIASDSSLLQNTYKRAKLLTRNVYVVSDVSHAHHVREQLDGLPPNKLIVEPGRRGTANCIVAALEYIARYEKPNEPLVFLAADHHIRDNSGFVHSFKVATKIAQKERRIVLVGVEPDYPATGFGYIKKGQVFDDENFVFNVDSFKEKPDYATAQHYVQSGDYLWNSGYFIGSIEVFLEKMKQKNPLLHKTYTALSEFYNNQALYKKTYLNLTEDAIDYALIEKLDDLLVVPASFDWKDLGSFSDIHDAVTKDVENNHVNGNHVALHQVDNSYVHTTEDKQIALVGVDNIVVINTKNGLLVARKDQSQKVKEALKLLERKK